MAPRQRFGSGVEVSKLEQNQLFTPGVGAGREPNFDRPQHMRGP